MIGRTSNAVALKLVNFASMDPSLQARGIKGAANASRLDREIWNEFYDNWDERAYQSEQLLAEKENTTPQQLNNIPEMELPKEGKTREAMIKVRVNQSFFRQMILVDYNNTCCITGIKQPELLVAGHIKPWSIDEKNRLNPQNGIAMNALHDKAFETGLLTITPELKVKISPSLFRQKNSQLLEEYFFRYDNLDIFSPSKFLPDEEFLIYHNEVRFKK